MRLAADDFGTGSSSLAYLARLPLRALKIDLSFVQGMEHDRSYAAIVRAVLTMARALGMGTTAEGVETAAQMRRVRRLGCQQGQGYYFARALPAEAVTTVLDIGHFAPLLRARARRAPGGADQQASPGRR